MNKTAIGVSAVNILIIKPSSMGDVVQALPVLKCLREKHPRAKIDWLVNQELGDILVDNPYLNTIHLWDRAGWRNPRRMLSALRNTVALLRKLRQHRYDVVFDLQGLLRSALIAFLSGGKEVIGFAEAREMAPMFYRKRVRGRPAEMHSVERYLLLVGADASAEKEFPVVFGEDVRRSTENLLSRLGYDRNRPFVILVPGARWMTKRWPRENFAALAKMLTRKQGAQVGFVGSSGESSLIERIASLSACPAMNFSGKTTLRQLAYLLKKADVVVGNDSGPIHVAAAVGTPVVGLYGPTSPMRTGPYGEQHKVLTSRLRCSPCFSRKCDVSAACMKQILAETVYQACEPYIEQFKTRKPRL